MICWIATARRTFVCFSPASRSPRSANTFPELRTIDSLFLDSLFRRFAISCLVVLAGHSQPTRDQLHITLGRLSALRRLLLERVQHINRMLELYRVHGPESIAAVVRDDLEDARTFALPRLFTGNPLRSDHSYYPSCGMPCLELYSLLQLLLPPQHSRLVAFRLGLGNHSLLLIQDREAGVRQNVVGIDF